MQKELIKDLLNQLKSFPDYLQCVYNNVKFEEGTTPIYYSGPYWDDDEIVEAVYSLICGKWLSSGNMFIYNLSNLEESLVTAIIKAIQINNVNYHIESYKWSTIIKEKFIPAIYGT